MSEETYYKLYREHRWLPDGNNPNVIGGRQTDLSQISLSLESTIKQMYPMNGVPKELAEGLADLKNILIIAEQRLTQYIEQVSLDVYWNVQRKGNT